MLSRFGDVGDGFDAGAVKILAELAGFDELAILDL